MKQEATKKMPKWLLPVIIAAAVLVVVGILLAIFLPGLGQGGSGAVQSKLYWNVDRLANIEEESGMSMREKGADGLYAIRFAVDGEQVEYKTTDKRLVNAIDMQDLMGLVFDADGLIVDIIDPKQIATEVAKDFFVKEHKGNTLVVNSSQAMNGMPMQIEITENTGIYNVTASAEVVGQRETTFTTMDKVIVYANEAGENTHIFIVQRFEEAGVYYRLARKYDSKLASTTRVPDENGVYTITFAHNGEQVDVKFKDKALVDKIDAGNKLSSPQMGLLFDEEGYAIKKIPVEEAIRGKQLFGYWHVTGVEGTTVNVQARWASLSTKGETGSFELPEDFDNIFLMETDCGATHAGVRVDSLQKDDCVYVYTDFEGNPLLIFVIRRNPGYPLYYNMTRKYSSTTNETTRKPDANGYYVFEVAGEGKTRTVKTKDKAVATKVDKQDRYLVGLKLEGDIIVDACSPVCATGRATAGSGRYVTELLGTIVRMSSASDMTSGANYVINPECKVYDVSDSYGIKVGAETELRLGDRVQAARNPEGELVAIYVYARYEEGAKIHFSPSRPYDSETKQTKREKDAEGYYVFQMCSDGKWVTVKTKDQKMATYIDKQSSKFVALRVASDGTIKGAYNVLYAIKYGYATLKNVYYTGVNSEGKFTYYTMSNGVRTDKVGHLKAANCIVYNTSSSSYIDHRGEKSTLQKDDYIYAFGSRENFQVTQVWIRGRDVDGPLYWGVNPQFDDATGETTRTPDANGYYNIEVLKDGKIVTVKTKDKAVASKVDDYNYAFGLIMKGDEVIKPVGATSVKGIEGYAYRNTYVKAIDGNKVHLVDMSPSSENYGKDLVLEFTKGTKTYDVSPNAATFGQATELKVGDKIASYQDEDGKVLYCFIRSRGAVFGECEACYKQAIAAGKTEAEAKAISLKAWSVFKGGDAEKNTHYYLDQDFLNYDKGSRFMIYSLTGTVCLDLNGHKVTMAKAYATADGEEMTSAAFRAYSNGVINLMDSKGTAVVEGYGYSTGGNNSGCAVEVRGTGILNIYGGTFKRAADAKAKVAVGCHTSSYAGQINIYGGTIDSIYARAGGKLTLAGAPKITELTIAGDSVANIDGLKPQAEIKVNGGNGKVLTAPSANAAAVKDCFVSIAGAAVEINSKNELVLSINVPDFTANAFTTDFNPAANGGYGYCEACYNAALAEGKTEAAAQEASLKEWSAFTGGEPDKDAHYYLNQDFENYKASTRFMDHKSSAMVCWNLNGHSVTMSTETTEALCRVTTTGGVLNIMDAKGTGMLAGYEVGTAGTNSGATVEIRNGGIVNIYGGDFRRVDGAVGNVALGCHTTVSGQFNIYGGTFDGVFTRSGLSIKLAGAPKISNLTIADGVAANIDELLPAAQISVKGSEGKVFTAPSDNAAAVVDCFTTVTSGLDVEVNDQKQLAIISLGTEPGTPDTPDAPEVNDEIFTTGFDPANNNGQAYCEACYKQAIAAGATEADALAASLKEWTVFTGGEPTKDKHYYLDQNFENYNTTTRFIDQKASGTYCLNLNGHSVSMASTGYSLMRAYGEGIINLMDAKGTGVLTGYDYNSKAGTNGGAVVEVRGNGTINIYGGTLLRAEGKGGNVAIGSYSTGYTGTINVYGGTIDGVYVRAGGEASLAGAPQITNLSTGTNVVVNIDGLLPAAQISVKGSEGKVFTAPSDNAAAVKDCFTTVTSGLDVDVNDQKQLVIVEATAAPEVDPFTEGFDPANNNNMAYCEACYKQALAAGMNETEAKEASLKEWTVFTGGTPEADKHYYLTESFDNYSATSRFMSATNVGKVCWNLNGFSVTMATTSTEPLARADRTVLNIMDAKGTGVLTGYKNNSSAGTSGGNVVEAYQSGVVNIYGGTFLRSTAEGASGKVAIGSRSGSKVFSGAINIYGGTIDGVFIRATELTTLPNYLSGAPVITGLSVGTNAAVNIDGLLPQAQITVKGEAGKVFTAPSDNAATVKGSFTAETDGLVVDVNDQKQLVIVEAPAEPAYAAQFVVDWVEANKAAFRAEDKLVEGATVEAPCPFCSPETNVVWTGFDSLGKTADDQDEYKLADGCHMYLIGDRIAEKGHNFLQGNSAATSHCVYFNGFNVGNGENKSAARIRARGNLNVIAYGSTIIRSANCDASTSDYGTVMLQGGGVANFYGGTYINNDSRANLIALTANSHTLSFYDVTLIDNASVAIENKGTVNLYNCTLTGAEGKVTIHNDIGSSTAIFGTVNVVGGTINGDIVNVEGTVETPEGSVQVGAQLVLSGDPVINGQLPANGVTTGQQGNQEQDPSSEAEKN